MSMQSASKFKIEECCKSCRSHELPHSKIY
jgi:hypothetical protein